jgi:hypothetical protein
MFNLTFHFLLDQNSVFTIQCDQKENKSDQALQIIRNVVAEFYANKRCVQWRREYVRSFIINHYYYYLSHNGENL